MVKFTASDFFTRGRWSGAVNRSLLSAMNRRRRRGYRKTFIREWRQHRGLTLEQLADRLDMTPSHMSMLERGQRAYTQETLEAVAEALQTDAASLLMRNPTDPDAIWSIWDQAQPGERRQIVEVARALLKASGH